MVMYKIDRRGGGPEDGPEGRSKNRILGRTQKKYMKFVFQDYVLLIQFLDRALRLGRSEGPGAAVMHVHVMMKGGGVQKSFSSTVPFLRIRIC